MLSEFSKTKRSLRSKELLIPRGILVPKIKRILVLKELLISLSLEKYEVSWIFLDKEIKLDLLDEENVFKIGWFKASNSDKEFGYKSDVEAFSSIFS